MMKRYLKIELNKAKKLAEENKARALAQAAQITNNTIGNMKNEVRSIFHERRLDENGQEIEQLIEKIDDKMQLDDERFG
jgi:uncharacterized protein YpiB (UPF0302 family)